MEMDVEEVEHKEVPKCKSEVVCMQDLVGCECSELDDGVRKQYRFSLHQAVQQGCC